MTEVFVDLVPIPPTLHTLQYSPNMSSLEYAPTLDKGDSQQYRIIAVLK